jgi:hypothetical protein
MEGEKTSNWSTRGIPESRRFAIPGPRFNLDLEVQVRAVGTNHVFQGRTREMNSRNVFVLCADLLPVGTPVELLIEWPPQLRGKGPSQLQIRGDVVSIEDHGMDISIHSCPKQVLAL